jgi:hypothetical protein
MRSFRITMYDMDHWRKSDEQIYRWDRMRSSGSWVYKAVTGRFDSPQQNNQLRRHAANPDNLDQYVHDGPRCEAASLQCTS